MVVQLSLAHISEYLTIDVIDRAFKLQTRSDDTVRNVEVSRAAPAGNGLIGAVYRIKISGKVYTTSFVAKAMARDPLLIRSLEPAKYFKREIEFFTEILPALANFQKAMGAKESIETQIPKCFAHHCDGVNDFILMEDLQETFCSQIPDVPNRTERNDILKMLAHLHAVSMACSVKNSAKFNKIAHLASELYYSETQRTWYTAYLQNAIQLNLQALAEYEDPKTSIYYNKYLRLVSNDPYGQMIKLVSEKGRKLALCHGDPWTPNYFRSKTRSVMIDFQICRVASPVIDLSFMLLLSCNQNPSIDYLLEALKMYHDAFSYYIKDMGLDAADVYSWIDLEKDLKEFGCFGMLAATTTIPLLVSEKSDVLADFGSKYGDVEKIPLEELWLLTPYVREEDKRSIINAVHLAVDVGFI